MKTIKFLSMALLASAVVFSSCKGNDPKPEPEPSETMPEVAAVAGKVVIVLNCVDEAEVCNPIVFAGNYNEWNVSNPAEMATFEAIEGYDGWYKVEITPDAAAATETSILEGKPNQLDKDGSFPSSWDFQWLAQTDDAGNVVNPCEVLKGSASLKTEYDVESSLIVAPGADVVYIRAHAWKKNPCVEAEKFNITFNVSVPAGLPESAIVYIAGGMNGWSADASPLTKVDATHWTISFESIELGVEYKYLLNQSWDNEELQAKEADADCANGVGNRKTNDRTMNDVVANFAGVTAAKCVSE